MKISIVFVFMYLLCSSAFVQSMQQKPKGFVWDGEFKKPLARKPTKLKRDKRKKTTGHASSINMIVPQKINQWSTLSPEKLHKVFLADVLPKYPQSMQKNMQKRKLLFDIFKQMITCYSEQHIRQINERWKNQTIRKTE